jgi:hypothetical protein
MLFREGSRPGSSRRHGTGRWGGGRASRCTALSTSVGRLRGCTQRRCCGSRWPCTSRRRGRPRPRCEHPRGPRFSSAAVSDRTRGANKPGPPRTRASPPRWRCELVCEANQRLEKRRVCRRRGGLKTEIFLTVSRYIKAVLRVSCAQVLAFQVMFANRASVCKTLAKAESWRLIPLAVATAASVLLAALQPLHAARCRPKAPPSRNTSAKS